MPSPITNVLFSEPSGHPSATVQIVAAILFAGLYAYSWNAGVDATWLLFMILGTGIDGIAESLPAERSVAAGVLRLLAIAVLLCLLAILLLAPDTIMG
jgi:hypothetical protein